MQIHIIKTTIKRLKSTTKGICVFRKAKLLARDFSKIQKDRDVLDKRYIRRQGKRTQGRVRSLKETVSVLLITIIISLNFMQRKCLVHVQ